jgi:hypothetical protein
MCPSYLVGIIPIHENVTKCSWIETQTQQGFLNQEMAAPFLDLYYRRSPLGLDRQSFSS